ncbi:MAG: hypothetical protein AB7S41_01390 [Parvibaculaceae bacterium]
MLGEKNRKAKSGVKPRTTRVRATSAPVQVIRNTYERHPLAIELIPPMSDEQREEVKGSIAGHGMIDPVVTLYEGKIIDGWERYQLCLELKETPRIVDLPEDMDPVVFLTAKNFMRKQVTKTQRAMAADRLANMERGRNKRAKNASSEELQMSVEDAAKLFGVSDRLVHNVRSLRHTWKGRCGGETVLDHMWHGRLSYRDAHDAHEYEWFINHGKKHRRDPEEEHRIRERDYSQVPLETLVAEAERFRADWRSLEQRRAERGVPDYSPPGSRIFKQDEQGYREQKTKKLVLHALRRKDGQADLEDFDREMSRMVREKYRHRADARREITEATKAELLSLRDQIDAAVKIIDEYAMGVVEAETPNDEDVAEEKKRKTKKRSYVPHERKGQNTLIKEANRRRIWEAKRNDGFENEVLTAAEPETGLRDDDEFEEDEEV